MGGASLAHAEDSYYEVVKVERAAFITFPDMGVKRRLEVGDILKEGDYVGVRDGHHIQIALDPEHQNVLYIKGETLIQLSDGSVNQFQLKKGKVYAILDQMKTVTKVEITTPSSIVASKNAQVKVETDGIRTEAHVYKGVANVMGRHLDGSRMEESVPVEAGEKTVVPNPGAQPIPPVRMTESELREIDNILALQEYTQEVLYIPSSETELSVDFTTPIIKPDNVEGDVDPRFTNQFLRTETKKLK